MVRIGLNLVNLEIADLPDWASNIEMPQCPSVGSSIIVDGREVRVLSEIWKPGTPEGEVDVILRVRVEGQR